MLLTRALCKQLSGLQGCCALPFVALCCKNPTKLFVTTVFSCACLQAVVLLEGPLAVGEAMEHPRGRAPMEAASQATGVGSQAMASRPQLQGAMGRRPLQASTPRRPSTAGGATELCSLCCAAISLPAR